MSVCVAGVVHVLVVDQHVVGTLERLVHIVDLSVGAHAATLRHHLLLVHELSTT